MKNRHKMTINISQKLHEEIKLLAIAQEMGMSEYVVDVLKDDQSEVCRLHDLIRDCSNDLVKEENKMVIWRSLAIAFFIGLVVQFLFLSKLNKDYIKLFNEGVPVSEDVSMVRYYKEIINNKCKIVEDL